MTFAVLLREAIDQVRTQGRWARYAGRISIAGAIAVGLARALHLQQGYWTVITALWVVQPSFSQTLKVSSLRLGGTALGAFVASLLDWLLPTRLLVGVSILPLATATLAGRAVNYLSYVLFLTPQFVLVAQLANSGLPPWALALSRLENSVAGAVVGLVVSFLIWPEWERHRLAGCGERAVLATRSYVAAGLDDVTSAVRHPASHWMRLRREACVAIDELEAVVAAVRLEPFHRTHHLAVSMVTVMRLRGLVGAVSLLEVGETALSEDERRRLIELAQWTREDWAGTDRRRPPPVWKADPDANSGPGAYLVRHVEDELVAGALMLRSLATPSI